MRPAAVLIGPPAAGKTRLGKRIARILDLPFVDTDARIVAEHGPIPEIFAEHGEPQFRQWERAAVIKALNEDAVVSLGGGAIEDETTRADLNGHVVVLVTVSEDAVAERLNNDNRPLLNGLESWKSLVARRMPTYEALATMTIDTSAGPMEQHAERLAEMVRAAH